ncbi:DUF3606 domain-containing protein [Clostridium butyricum]|uniref:DUF3606 domain-containing protein n=1 Tax=Clostridium butyricum TaxID=1492 RepID=UPI0022E3C56B|nr:DUF3606 domain-containing protein [Clostridium butyricum]MBS5982305.1 DUF3606 domain-containing protein [Clostridium butyricum]
MSDNTGIKQPEDPKKINVNQSWEVEYWCKVLGCTKEQLKAAVKKVGPMVVDVKKELNK